MAHPRKYDETNPKLRRLREMCLALPDVVEKEAWGERTYRVDGGTMFAMTDCNHHDSGHVAVWVKAAYMVQEGLVEEEPEKFFRPPYLGGKGWVGVRLDVAGVAWKQLGELLEEARRMSLPKRPRAKAAPGAKKRTAKAATGARARKARPRAT